MDTLVDTWKHGLILTQEKSRTRMIKKGRQQSTTEEVKKLIYFSKLLQNSFT
jgi:hypothetical protein